MSVDNDFQRQAIVAHVAQQLAGPSRAITGFQELLTEQARDLGLVDLMPDLERVGVAAQQLNILIDRLIADQTGCAEIESEAKLRHDLRTPLNAIIGYSEMILEEAENLNHNALAEDVRVMLAASGELLAHVDAFAGISRTGDIEGFQAADRTRIDAARLERALNRTEGEAPRLTTAGSLSSTISRATATSFRDGCSGTAIMWSPPQPARPPLSGSANRSSTSCSSTCLCRT